jgi:hypothetical protein
VSRDWKYSFDQQVDNSNDVEIKMLLTQNLDLQGAMKASALTGASYKSKPFINIQPKAFSRSSSRASPLLLIFSSTPWLQPHQPPALLPNKPAPLNFSGGNI